MDGKIFTVVGKRGVGKSLLAHYFFLSSKNPTFYFSFKEPLLPPKNFLKIYGLKQFINIKLNKDKIYYIYTDDYDLNIFEYLKDVSKMNFIFDEADFLVSKKRPNENILYILKYTREQQINQFYICRRPVELHTDILSLSDGFFIFNLTNIRDLDYIKNSLHLSNEVILKITKLKQYQFIYSGEIQNLYSL
jgi:hypothetical protein